jgi:hypothetical protein
MSALVDVELCSLFMTSAFSRLTVLLLKRIAVKMESGFLDVDDVAVTVGISRAG